MKPRPTFKQLSLVAVICISFAAAVLTVGARAETDNNTRPLGDSRVFAPFPAEPGFPEAIAINGDRVYVSGPAQFNNFVQPAVIAYDLNTGAQVAEYPILGQNPNLPQAADGIAFGKSGKLYVALAGTGQISVLRPDGTEETRYSGPAQNPANPSPPLPWANPSAIAFDDKTRSLLVTNHAIFFPNAAQFFAVFDVYVDDKADHLARPHVP
ncbi:MAG TPA: SMP-30/gluconolactonase/LRE family protein [Pyrinomonadaceae bacterium]|nr:SMP-30/gluconolactonase/LRE family protein [Pyrinomonadaceae bacterium]